MSTSAGERSQEGNEGFTLIELMVVVLIIAILLAIAIPTFLGARDRANDRAAQASLRNALTAAKTIYTDNQSFASADENPATGLPAVEPSLAYVASATPSTTFKEVSVNGTAGSAWYGASMSKSGTCFQIKDSTLVGGGGTTYRNTTAGACSAGDAVTNSGSFVVTGW